MRTTRIVRTVRTSELEGLPLDWAVAKCERLKVARKKRKLFITGHMYLVDIPLHLLYGAEKTRGWYTPSTTWALGGRIIEQRGIDLHNSHYLGADINRTWSAERVIDNRIFTERGRSPLLAAMRCYVASELGDEIGLPRGI